MENEIKEKVKKMKAIKKESNKNEFKDDENENLCILAEQREALIVKKDADRQNFIELKSKEEKFDKTRNIPENFYIAHPKSVKKATNFFQDVHSRKLAELLEAFHIFDFDRDGIINREDLKKTFASLNWNEVNEEEIDQMLLEGLDPLNFDAFVILLGYKTLDLDPEEVLLDALSNWDEHHEGFILHDRLLHDIMALGDKFTEKEATTALADAPMVFTRTKEKMIDYIQFSEDLCGLRKMMQRKTPIYQKIK